MTKLTCNQCGMQFPSIAHGEMSYHEKKHDDAMRQNWDRAESNRVLKENAELRIELTRLPVRVEDAGGVDRRYQP